MTVVQDDVLRVPVYIANQLEEVRQSGMANMLYRSRVREVADLLGQDELVEWIDTNSKGNFARLVVRKEGDVIVEEGGASTDS